MAFTGTLIKNGGALGYHTAFAAGNAPVPAANAISIVGTVANGNIIDIISGEDIDFGDDMPDLLFATDLNAAGAAGTDYDVVEGVTVRSGYICTTKASYTSSEKLEIKAVAGMPNGKGLALGDKNTSLAIKSGSTVGGSGDFSVGTGLPPVYGKLTAIVGRPSRQRKITYITVWPADEQLNFVSNSVLGEQTKIDWHYNGIDGYLGGGSTSPDSSDWLNLWVGLPSGTGGGTIDSQSYTINSSTSVTVTIAANAVSNYLVSGDAGRVVQLSNLSSVGVAGNATVASVSGTNVNLTVSGWPSSGSGTLSVTKLGLMQTVNRTIRANQYAFIENANTDYLLNKNGTITDPYTTGLHTQNPNILIHQVFIDAGLTTNTVSTRIIDTTVGEIYSYVEQHPRVSTLDPNRDKFDRMTLIGNSQGVNTNFITGNPVAGKGKCSYIGDMVHQYGNASFSVEISDTADNGVATKKLTQLVIISGSAHRLRCLVVGGIYGTANLAGQYIHIYSDYQTKLVSKQI